MAILVTATEQYFPVVLFIMLYKVVLGFESVDQIQMTIQMKATEQYFPVVLFNFIYITCCLSCCTRWFLSLSLWMKS